MQLIVRDGKVMMNVFWFVTVTVAGELMNGQEDPA
jgi:hypothetical protein